MDERLTRKDLAREFNKDLRTIDRWKADGTLPKPKRWHGQPYWTRKQLKVAEQVQINKWTARERARAKLRSKLRRAVIQQKISTGKLNPQQLALPLI